MYSTIHQEIPGQIAKNKSQTYFCNEQEKQAWARELNRSSVGCELNPDYVKIIKKRLQSDSCLDTGTVKYEFKKV